MSSAKTDNRKDGGGCSSDDPCMDADCRCCGGFRFFRGLLSAILLSGCFFLVAGCLFYVWRLKNGHP